VEEVATLAARLGWGYDTLMAMTTAERRLWLAASEKLGSPPAAATMPARGGTATPVAAPGAANPATPVAPGRLTTEDERRARLVELLEEMTARRRRP
jgi:hypothetical protein